MSSRISPSRTRTAAAEGRRPTGIAARLAAAGLLLSWWGTLPALSQIATVPDSDKHTYAVTESGSLTHLGVRVEVKPELGPPVITGFWVAMSYDDPVVINDPGVNFLAPTFFPVSCSSGFALRPQEPFTWYNKRGTGFAVTFEQHCKRVEPGRSIPYLEFRIWCTNPDKEQRYIRVAKDRRMFDISPQGETVMVKNEIHDALVIGQRTFQLVSAVATVLDIVAFTRGGLTASKFVMKMVVGQTLDHLVNGGFDYAKSEFGYKARFHHTGWLIVCRLCDHTFSRQALTDGELLRCPRPTCEGEAHIRFE